MYALNDGKFINSAYLLKANAPKTNVTTSKNKNRTLRRENDLNPWQKDIKKPNTSPYEKHDKKT